MSSSPSGPTSGGVAGVSFVPSQARNLPGPPEPLDAAGESGGVVHVVSPAGVLRWARVPLNLTADGFGQLRRYQKRRRIQLVVSGATAALALAYIVGAVVLVVSDGEPSPWWLVVLPLAMVMNRIAVTWADSERPIFYPTYQQQQHRLRISGVFPPAAAAWQRLGPDLLSVEQGVDLAL